MPRQNEGRASAGMGPLPAGPLPPGRQFGPASSPRSAMQPSTLFSSGPLLSAAGRGRSAAWSDAEEEDDDLSADLGSEVDQDLLLSEWEDALVHGPRCPGSLTVPVIFCLLLLGTSALVLFTSASNSRRTLEESAMQTLEKLAQLVSAQLRTRMRAHEYALRLILLQAAREQGVSDAGCDLDPWTQDMRTLLHDVLLATDEFSWIFYGSPQSAAMFGYLRRADGRLNCTVASSRWRGGASWPGIGFVGADAHGDCMTALAVRPEPYRLEGKEWFTLGQGLGPRQLLWVPIYLYSDGNLGTSLIGATGTGGCVFGSDLALSYLHKELTSVLPWPKAEGSITVLRRDSRLVASTEIHSGERADPLAEEHDSETVRDAAASIDLATIDGPTKVLGDLIIHASNLSANGIDWVIVLTVSRSYVWAQWQRSFHRTIVITACIVSAGVVGGGALLHFTFAPVRTVAKGMLTIAESFDVDLKTAERTLARPSRVAEVRTIQIAFLRMITKLRSLRSYMPEMLFTSNASTAGALSGAPSVLRAQSEQHSVPGPGGDALERHRSMMKAKDVRYQIVVYTERPSGARPTEPAVSPRDPLASRAQTDPQEGSLKESQGAEVRTPWFAKPRKRGSVAVEAAGREAEEHLSYDELHRRGGYSRSRFEFILNEENAQHTLEWLKSEVREHSRENLPVGVPINLYCSHTSSRDDEVLMVDDAVLQTMLSLNAPQSPFVLRCQRVQRTQPFSLFVTIAEWADLITDLMFTFKIRQDYAPLFLGSLILLIGCSVVNICLSLVLLRRARDKSVFFSNWLDTAVPQCAACVVLATANVVALELLWSQVPIPNMKLWAPVPGGVRVQIMRAATWTMLTHNIPQVMLQLYIVLSERKFDTLTILTMVTSLFGLLCTVVKRLVSFVLVSYAEGTKRGHGGGVAPAAPSALQTGLERRRVTVMITRLEGVDKFMPLAFGPQGAAGGTAASGSGELARRLERVLSSYYNTVFSSVGELGGMVNQFNQTTVVSVFGWVHPDDHEALACACAVEIERRVYEDGLERFYDDSLIEEQQDSGGGPAASVLRVASAISTNELFVGSLGSASHKAFHLFGLDVQLLDMLVDLQNKVLNTRVLATDSTIDIARAKLREWGIAARPVDCIRVPAGRSIIQSEEITVTVLEVLEAHVLEDEDVVTPAFEALSSGDYEAVCEMLIDHPHNGGPVAARLAAVGAALRDMPRIRRPRDLKRGLRNMFESLPGEMRRQLEGSVKWASVTARLLEKMDTVSLSPGAKGAAAAIAAMGRPPAPAPGSPRARRNSLLVGADAPPSVSPSVGALTPQDPKMSLGKLGLLVRSLHKRLDEEEGGSSRMRELGLAASAAAFRSTDAGPRRRVQRQRSGSGIDLPAAPYGMRCLFAAMRPQDGGSTGGAQKRSPSRPRAPRRGNLGGPGGLAAELPSGPSRDTPPPARSTQRLGCCSSPPATPAVPELLPAAAPPPAPAGGLRSPAASTPPVQGPLVVGAVVTYTGGGRFPRGWTEEWGDGLKLVPGMEGVIESVDSSVDRGLWVGCCFRCALQQTAAQPPQKGPPAAARAAAELRVRLSPGDLLVARPRSAPQARAPCGGPGAAPPLQAPPKLPPPPPPPPPPPGSPPGDRGSVVGLLRIACEHRERDRPLQQQQQQQPPGLAAPSPELPGLVRAPPPASASAHAVRPPSLAP
eukprot:TRINITY_DN11096_c1_g1_i1.p1 TRINITY_DN11096_c1_g1~~TRINITY_DN11096_c1_g1_i1.p1  ORF type:complete len:1690 (+),score=395.52 TRINITY_DN11096_c1_g1_i1:114-5183(+)